MDMFVVVFRNLNPDKLRKVVEDVKPDSAIWVSPISVKVEARSISMLRRIAIESGAEVVQLIAWGNQAAAILGV